MAVIRLLKREMRGEDLPPICARCGEPGDSLQVKKSYWAPSWVILIFFISPLICLIVYFAVRKRAVYALPFCHVHETHWSGRRNWLLATFFAGVILSGMGGIISANDRPDEPIGQYVLAVGLAAITAWFIMAIGFGLTSIRLTGFRDGRATITGIAATYRDALLIQREARKVFREEQRRASEYGDEAGE